MKTFLALLFLFFVTLFLVTMFGQSAEVRAQAERYFSEETIERGRQYSFERRLFFWGITALETGLLLLFVFTPLGRRLTDRISALVRGRWLLTVLLVGLVFFLLSELLLLPIVIARFYHTRAWGLSERSLVGWFGDYQMGLVVALVTGAIGLVGLYLVIRWSPRRWWVLAGLGGGILGVVYAYLMPLVINPLFNTFTPLGQTEWAGFEGMVQRLALRADVPVDEVLVMNASRQSHHSNAYFTGFFGTRRIVLYDNLLKKHTPAEIESILAHEMGHWRRDHIVKGMTLGVAGSLLAFFVLSRLLIWAQGRGALALRAPWDPAGLFLILLAFNLGWWLAMPVQNVISRHFECQADEDALRLAGQPEAFIAAEKKLAVDNIGNVAPNPFNVWLFSSHPPTIERIRMAEKWPEKLGIKN